MDYINNLIDNGALTDLFFWVFAALTLLCGILVIANPARLPSSAETAKMRK